MNRGTGSCARVDGIQGCQAHRQDPAGNTGLLKASEAQPDLGHGSAPRMAQILLLADTALAQTAFLPICKQIWGRNRLFPVGMLPTEVSNEAKSTWSSNLPVISATPFSNNTIGTSRMWQVPPGWHLWGDSYLEPLELSLTKTQNAPINVTEALPNELSRPLPVMWPPLL